MLPGLALYDLLTLSLSIESRGFSNNPTGVHDVDNAFGRVRYLDIQL